MPRFLLAPFASIAMPSCDCEPGKTGPHALFRHFIKNPTTSPPSPIQLGKFNSALEHAGNDELYEMLALLDTLQEIQDSPYQTWRIPAEAVIDELWQRIPNPEPHELYKMLGDDNTSRFRNRMFLNHLAHAQPSRGLESHR